MRARTLSLLFYFISFYAFSQSGEQLFPKLYSNGKYGYVNRSGSFVIQANFQKAFKFQGDYAKVIVQGKWGLINQKGEYLEKPKYDYLGWADDPYFFANANNLGNSNPIIPVGRSFFDPFEEYIGAYVGGSWKLIEIGKGAQSKSLLSIRHMEGGFAPSKYEIDEIKGWTWINRKGQFPKEIELHNKVQSLSCGLVAFKDSSLFRIIDPKTTILYPWEFVEVSSLNEGYYAARSDSGWGIISKHGEAKSDLIYSKVTYKKFIDSYFLYPKTKWGLFDSKLRPRSELDGDTAYFVEPRHLGLIDGPVSRLINLDNGNEKLFSHSSKAFHWTKGYYFLDGGKWTVYGESKEGILSAQYNVVEVTELPTEHWIVKQKDATHKILSSDFKVLAQDLLSIDELGNSIFIVEDAKGIHLFKLGPQTFQKIHSAQKYGQSNDQWIKYFDSTSRGLVNFFGDSIIDNGLKAAELIGEIGYALELPEGRWAFRVKDTTFFTDALWFDYNDDNLIRVAKGISRFGYLKTDGAWMLPPNFDYLSAKDQSWIYGKKNGAWSVFDIQNEDWLFEFDALIDSIGYFKNGLFEVWISGNKGWMNKLGHLVISTQYQDVRPAIGGLFPFKIKGKWGLLDQKENIILQPRYQTIENAFGNIWICDQNGKVGLLNKDANWILEPDLDAVKIDDEFGLIICQKGRFFGVFSQAGDQILSFNYEDVHPWEKDSFIVKKGGNWIPYIKGKEEQNIFRASEVVLDNSRKWLLIKSKYHPKQIKLD